MKNGIFTRFFVKCLNCFGYIINHIINRLNNKLHNAPSKRWYLITITHLYIENLKKICLQFDELVPNLILNINVDEASRRVRDKKLWEPLKKAHLGCGDVYLKSYINVDMPLEGNAMSDYHGIKVDKRAYLHDLNIFQDSSLDVIEMYHVFEHIQPWKINETIHEILRILKPGGELVLECPDIFKCSINYIIDPFYDKISTMGFYGDQKYELESNMHYAGYSPETLIKLFLDYGFNKSLVFTIPSRRWQHRDFRIVAYKDGINSELAKKHTMERVIIDTVNMYQL